MAVDPELLRIFQLSEAGKEIISRLEEDIRILEGEMNRLRSLGIDVSDLETQLRQAKEQLQKMKSLGQVQ